MNTYEPAFISGAVIDPESYEEEGFIERKQKDDFHIKKSYDDEMPKTLICKKCGADYFIVGQGSYFTAIKCKKCEWEICIHDG